MLGRACCVKLAIKCETMSIRFSFERKCGRSRSVHESRLADVVASQCRNEDTGGSLWAKHKQTPRDRPVLDAAINHSYGLTRTRCIYEPSISLESEVKGECNGQLGLDRSVYDRYCL